MTTITGLEKLRPLLLGLTEQMMDLSPVMQEIAEIGDSSIQQNFRVGGRFGSGEFGGGTQRWPESERARTEGGRTLLDTAHLSASVTSSVSGNSVSWGTNLVYAATMQFGRKKDGGTSDPDGDGFVIPPRPFVVLQDIDIEDMIDVVLGYYSGLIG